MTFQIEAPLLMWELFWKGAVFWFKGCSRHFCPKKRVWLKRFPFMSARKGIMVQGIADTIFVSKKGLWLKGLFIPFLSARKGYGLKDCQKWTIIFWSTCPKVSIKVISEYHGFGVCIFGHWKGLGRFEAIASLDAYQITKYQTLQKLIIFFIAWFSKNSRKRVSKSGVL